MSLKFATFHYFCCDFKKADIHETHKQPTPFLSFIIILFGVSQTSQSPFCGKTQRQKKKKNIPIQCSLYLLRPIHNIQTLHFTNYYKSVISSGSRRQPLQQQWKIPRSAAKITTGTKTIMHIKNSNQPINQPMKIF